MINIELFSSGYCTGNRKHIHRSEPSEKLIFHASWALIEHPKIGYILFDTGYSGRFYEITKKFPFKLYSIATPVFHKEEQSCINTLKRKGLNAKDIKHVIISHFHADHIGGVKDFTETKMWFTKKSWEHFNSKNNWTGVFSAYLKPLIPEKLNSNFIDTKFEKINWNGFNAWEWEEDLIFVDLPGHSIGQIGLFIKNTNLGDIFLVADASWTTDAIRNKKYPSKIVKVFVDDYSKVTGTIDKLNNFYKSFPDTLFIPTHCNEIAQKFSF